MGNEIQTIVKWFSDAKPNPTIEDASTQYGFHLEEFAEGLSATEDLSLRDDVIESSNYYKGCDNSCISELTLFLKNDYGKVELLYSLCEQVVTAVGTAQYMGFDIIGALNEVIASNDSKRMPDGSFPLDEYGKITKESPNFFKPDLSKFINKV